jgi:hypothetical protein
MVILPITIKLRQYILNSIGFSTVVIDSAEQLFDSRRTAFADY